MGTYREVLRRRIILKEQLILLERREIEALQKQLEDLSSSPEQEVVGELAGRGMVFGGKRDE